MGQGSLRQLEVMPFEINSALCVCSNTFSILIYTQQYRYNASLPMGL